MQPDFQQHGIKRYSGGAKGRSRVTAFGDLVFTVATAPGASMAEQTAATLALIDKHLGDAGSSREHILSATVYVTDINAKQEMDDVWCEWIGGPENWPQRACVQAQLAGDTLVEITIIAARAE